MAFGRLVVASMTLTAVAACGLNAVGETAPDASMGIDSPSGPDVGRGDTHVGNSDAHASSDAHQNQSSTSSGSGSSSGTGTSSGSGSSTASSSGSSGGDAGTCPSPPDCSIEACREQGYNCIPAYPTGVGWIVATADIGGSSSCPTGYTALPGPLVTAPTNTAPQCTCSCSVGSTPSCTSAGQDFEIYYGNASCGMADYPLNAGGGGCTASVALEANLMIHTPAPATGGSCTLQNDAVQPPNGSSSADVCTTTAVPLATGCGANQVCAATAPNQKPCVYYPGASACPIDSYTTAFQLGSSVTDDRACTGSCSGCGTPTTTCENPTFTLYNGNTTCTGIGTVIGTSCTTSNASQTMGNSYKYSATPSDTACGSPSSTYTPTGSAALVGGPAALCCVP